ncbi:L-seryl-tRNA(Sec) kinase-like isoform X1 [Megalobrama amblycephala]|uniref:L-seryl-tRNA(Sec) kinase-like isoform X1 n=2 Tax=Megalobrama amblycephala TaxID=75352 RepID=UPI002014371B|nr:L-seryl-tRNA(Sec) kinase-like isoform X1 [Megalobrama amblycephala]
MSPAPACLCVLCGLPAAGKSRLARELRGHAHALGWRTLLVTYDELIPARDWQETEWKQHRKTVLMCLERFLRQTHTLSDQTHTVSDQTHTVSDQTHTLSDQTHTLSDQTHTLSDQTHTLSDQTHTLSDQTHTLSDQTHTLSDQTHTLSDQTHTLSDQTHTLSDQTHTLSDSDDDVWRRFEQMLQQQSVSHTHTHSQPLVLLLDDNFYYQSMRYQIHQLARKYGVGFCQVFLRCPLHVCLQRNQQRSQSIPDEVLLHVCERMEPPNPSRNRWEQQSLTLDGTDRIADLQKLMDLLASALENPLRPVQDESQQKEADRQICASSVLHQADQTCRRLVSQAVASAREAQASPDVLKALAKELNELKTRFLQDLKKDVLHQVSVFPEEELLMDVMAGFERRTRDCVQTRVNITETPDHVTNAYSF